jgi:hypothetical protein
LDSYQAGFERLSPSEKAGRVIVTRGETAHQFAIMDDTVAGILFAKGNQRLPRYPRCQPAWSAVLPSMRGFAGAGLAAPSSWTRSTDDIGTNAP